MLFFQPTLQFCCKKSHLTLDLEVTCSITVTLNTINTKINTSQCFPKDWYIFVAHPWKFYRSLVFILTWGDNSSSIQLIPSTHSNTPPLSRVKVALICYRYYVCSSVRNTETHILIELLSSCSQTAADIPIDYFIELSSWFPHILPHVWSVCQP